MGFLSIFSSNMIDLAIIEIPLTLVIVPRGRGSPSISLGLIGLLLRTIPRKVARVVAMIAWSLDITALGVLVLVWLRGCRASSLLIVGTWGLEIWPWILEIRALHRKIRAWSIHGWPSIDRWAVALLWRWWHEARARVTIRRLSLEDHLPFALSFHFIALVFNYERLIHEFLETLVVGVQQLELKVIGQSLEKQELLLRIIINIFWGISR